MTRGLFTDDITLNVSLEKLEIRGVNVLAALIFIEDKKGLIPELVHVYPLYDNEEKKKKEIKFTRKDIKYLLTKELYKTSTPSRYIRALTIKEGKVFYDGKVYVFDPNDIVPKVMKKIEDRTQKELMYLHLKEYNQKMQERKRVHITRL